MSFTNAKQAQAMINAAAFQQESQRGVQQIYAAYPTLLHCHANNHLIESLCREFMGQDIAPSLDTWRNIIALNPDVMESMMATRPIDKQRAQITEDILSLLASKNDGRDGKFDAHNLRTEAKRMESWSLDALRLRAAEIRTKQGMSSQPVEQLKSFVADSRRDARRFPGYPDLPKSTWNAATGTHVPVNAAFFRSLDAFEIRRYTRLYSGDQVNERIKETQ